MDLTKYAKSELKGKIKEAVKTAESLRKADRPLDISFEEVMEDKFNLELPAVYDSLGINPEVDTIHNIMTLPDEDIRWLVPEIFRDALRLGIRNAPIWPGVTVTEESAQGLSQVVPHINLSEATPARVGEAETIPLGAISYGSRKVGIYKVGRGIKISDEVLQFSSLNVVSIFLEDFGVKMGQALDVLAIDMLINGDQADGSMSAPVIGTATGSSKTYADFLKIWIRMSRLGRNVNTIIGGEAAALLTLDMAEFKDSANDAPPLHKINLKTPVPSQSDYYIHGNVSTNQELIVDPTRALIKLNAIPLNVESDRIVSNQTNEFYASLTTGFFKMFRDAALIMDKSVTYTNYPFPSWMNVDAALNVVLL